MDLSHFDRYPTVEELLRLPSFSCSRVCGGHAGLDRLVRGVNLTDTPDYSRWLSAGELLITTGFSIAGDQQAVDALLPTAERCGLSGVCIKAGRYLPGCYACRAGGGGRPAVPSADRASGTGEIFGPGQRRVPGDCPAADSGRAGTERSAVPCPAAERSAFRQRRPANGSGAGHKPRTATHDPAPAHRGSRIGKTPPDARGGSLLPTGRCPGLGRCAGWRAGDPAGVWG